MPTMQTPPGPITVVDGRQYLYFAGTGYLGLQGHPAVIAAACEAAEEYGTGSATARTPAGLGNTPPVLLAEERAAELFDSEAALYLPSGYLAPQVLLAALGDVCDVVLLDEHCHYALRDAARLAGKPTVTFRHRDPGNLLEMLHGHAAGNRCPLAATDGVFAAGGSLAPLPDYCEVLRAYPGAALLVDDAHGIGVLGERGRGSLEHVGLFHGQVNAGVGPPGAEAARAGPRIYLCASLSKAIGGHGGIVPGTRGFIEWIRRVSPACSGATPPPPPIAAATAEGLRIVQCEPELRRRLHANTRTLKAGLRRIGFDVDDGPAPIASICLESAEMMQQFQQDLARRGIMIAYFSRYAGLPPQGALRIAVFATHTEAMIERLLDELGRLAARPYRCARSSARTI